MLLSAVSVLVVAQSSSEIPEGLMNNPVYNAYGIVLATFGPYVFVHLVALRFCDAVFISFGIPNAFACSV